MARLALSFLGPFAVTLDGVPVTSFHWDKVRALLAYLAVEADRPHARDALAGLLWPDCPERTARINLRSCLANLCKAIGDREAVPPYLVITREAVQLNTASDCQIDVALFDALAKRGEWEAAVALYRSPFLEGFFLSDSPAFEQWVLVVRERLLRQMMAALEGWIAKCEEQWDYPQAIALARHQLEVEPWHESAHRALMRALTLNGERASALAQYETCCCLLREELDVEPGEETTRLYEHIRDGQDLTGFGKPVRSAVPSNLPAQLTPFVRREDLLAQIGERLQNPTCRLLTLVGPGGSGKTRLALEAAARQVERYQHGVWFVPLAPLREVESIVPTIARSLRLTFHGEREREVFSSLSVFRGGFAWEAAGEVAGASPRKLMALIDKSLLYRTVEGRYELHELLRQYAAEQLATSPYRERAVCDRHSAYYAAALEHWAADLKGPQQQIALAEMEAEIENAHTAWDWAVEQGEVERLTQAMDGLGWFYLWRGRYPEGESACRTAVDALSTASSNISTTQVARQRTLARLLAWQSVHSTYLGHTQAVRALSRRSLALVEECERAGEDVRLERAFALSAAGLPRGYSGVDREGTAEVLEESLALYRALGAYDRAAQVQREGLAIHRQLGDPLGIAESLGGLGWVLLDQGDLTEAEHLMRESLGLRLPMSDPIASAEIKWRLSSILVFQGRFAEASLLEEAASAVANEVVSDPARAACTMASLGEIDLHMGRYAEGRCKAQAALAHVQDGHCGWQVRMVLLCLGSAAMAEGAYIEAQRHVRDSLVQFQRTETQSQVVWAHAALGGVAVLRSHADEAFTQLLEALRVLTEDRSFTAALYTLPYVALLLAKREQAEQAAEVYALAERYPYVANSRFWKDVVGKHVAAAAATLPPHVLAAAQERGRARELWATVEELLVGLEQMESK